MSSDFPITEDFGIIIDFDKFPNSNDFLRVGLVANKLSSALSSGYVGFFGGEYQSMTLFY